MQWLSDSTHQSGSLLDKCYYLSGNKAGQTNLVSDQTLILFGIAKHQAPGRITTVKYRLNESAQVIQQELSDVHIRTLRGNTSKLQIKSGP